ATPEGMVMTGLHPVPRENEAVTRRLHVNLESLSHVLDTFGETTERLRIDTPFTRMRGTPALWRANGRLFDRTSRFARGTSVELELSAWSTRVTELRIRPVSRRVPNWGPSRCGRYFDLAHDIVDRLVPSLERAVRRHEHRQRAAQSMRVVRPVD